jgi:FMN reductase
MHVTIVSCSLNDDSRSAQLADAAVATMPATGAEATLLDLRQWALPMCDGQNAYDDPRVQQLQQQLSLSPAVLLAVPVYNYYANAAAKNLIELTGEAWQDKVVGFLCAAGGRGSYMSVMSLANSLMLDFRCLIVPRFVYATAADFAADENPSADLQERIENLCQYTVRLAKVTGQLPQSE